MSKYIQHIIQYFFGHDLPEELTDKVQQRIARAKDDPTTEETFKNIWDTIENSSLDDDDVEAAYVKVSTSLYGQERRIPPYQWLRIAAIWVLPVLMLASSLYFYQAANRQDNQLASISLIHKFATNGNRELIVLPDSSKVWLNAGSVLIYPSQFLSDERNVCLSGEAYFDVIKDASHPFIVSMNLLKLTVLGTTFNVSSYPDSPEIITTLETGKVQINIEGRTGDYFLNPSDQLVYNSKTGEVNISQVNTSDYSAWRTGALYFNDTPFVDAIKQLERAYSVKIHVLSSNYNGQTIRAHFNPNEPIDRVMDIIKMLIPSLNYEIREKDIYIK
ncbi:MAG: DUF4974 domain-containing protein [Prevotella sp.]|nr:DUF4974 domain-containing protein [Prevotella sp.]